jgi:methylisocitrate lyase
MSSLSRRDFGKKVSVAALGGLAAASVESGGAQAVQPSTQPTAALRQMLKKPGIVTVPGIYDAISARVAEWVGFPWVDVAGSAVGVATCITEPALSLEDMAETVRRITAAVHVPVTVDVGAGYGEPAHVAHTVRWIEHAGASGMHLEDQIYPKRFHYHIGIEHTIPAEAMVEKIHYALEARRDPDFVLIARTDTMRTHSFAEGIRRANLYAEAGADVIQLFPNTIDEAKQVPKEVHAPLNYVNGFVGGSRPIIPAQDLEAMGYKLLFVIGPSPVGYKAIRDMLRHLKQTGNTGMTLAEFGPIEKEIQDVIGLPYYYEIENKTTEKA